MKKVYQTIISKDNGNCFTSCISTLTGIPQEEFPDLFAKGEGYFFDEAYKFLEKKNIAMVIIDNPIGANTSGLYLPTIKNVHAILSVPSQKFEKGLHAVVGVAKLRRSGALNFDIVHDPNKNNKKYKKGFRVYQAIFLVPLKPWKAQYE